MKKILALMLTFVMILTSLMSVSLPMNALARETSEIVGNIGNFKTVLATVNVGEGNITKNTSLPSGLVKGDKRGTGTFAFVPLGTAKNVTDETDGKTYTAYTNAVSTVNKSTLDENVYPGVKNGSTDKFLKLTQTANSGLIRFNDIFNGNLGLSVGDQITLTSKIYLGDIRSQSAGTDSEGSSFGAVNDTTTKEISLSYRLITSKGENSVYKRINVPVNVWYTMAYTVNVTSDNLSEINGLKGVRISCLEGPDTLKAYTSSHSQTMFVENITLSKFTDTSTTHLNKVNYTDDFEDIDFNMEYNNNGYRYISRSENFRFNEDKITVNTMLSSNVGAGKTGTYNVNGTDYTYTYSAATVLKNSSGTRNGGNNRGRVQVWGTTSSSTMGVTSAAMFADSTVPHKTASPGAADFIKDSSASGVQTISTKAHSGTKSIAVTSRCYWGTGFKFGNIFGFNPTSVDSGRTFRIKFYIYPDSTRGGYKNALGFAAAGDVTKSHAVTADKITPRIKVQMTSGPSQYYKYRNSGDTLINVANPTLEWDKWNEVSFEWTVGTCYDNGDNSTKTGNPLVNVLTITDYAKTDIIDTFYFDDLTVEEITPVSAEETVDQQGYKKVSVIKMESKSDITNNTWVNINGSSNNTTRTVNKAYDDSFKAPTYGDYDFGKNAVGWDFTPQFTDGDYSSAGSTGMRLIGKTANTLKEGTKYKMTAWVYPETPSVSGDTYAKMLIKPATSGKNPSYETGRSRYVPYNKWSKIEIVFKNDSSHISAGAQPGIRAETESNQGYALRVYFEDVIFEEYVGNETVPYGLNIVQDFESIPANTDSTPSTTSAANYENSVKPYRHMYEYYKTPYPSENYSNSAYAPLSRSYGTGVATVNYSYNHTRSGIVSSKTVKNDSLSKNDLGGPLYANIFGGEFGESDIGRTFRVTAYVYIDKNDVYKGDFGEDAGYGNDFNQEGTYFSLGLGGLDAYCKNSSSVVSFAKADAAMEATHRNCTYNLKTGFVPYGVWTPVTTYYTVTEDTIFKAGSSKSNAINALRVSQTMVENIATSQVPMMKVFYVDDIEVVEMGTHVTLSGSVSGDTYTADAVIKNTLSDDYISAVLIIAAYDINGEFISMTVSEEPVVFNSDSDFPLDLTLSMDKVDGGYKYMAFLWSDIDDLVMPYTKTIEIK